MTRLIDADKLPHYDGTALSAAAVARAVENAQTIDVESLITQHEDIGYERGYRDGYAEAWEAEPVKHGEWEEENTRTRSMKFKCSVCGKIAYYPQNHHSTDPKRCGYAYCPNCGAKMDGGKDNANE